MTSAVVDSVKVEGAPSNRVTLFSNGMGHISRVVTVPANGVIRISIPFNKEHISDALESLTVLGRVKYAVPPSYTPTNADNPTLTINPQNVTASLFTSLSGASFSYRLLSETASWVGGDKGWYDSILVGIETVNTILDQGIIQSVVVTVQKKDGSVSRLKLDELAEYRFTDSSVQSEIEKSVKANFQKIKPDATFLDLALSSTTGNQEKAVISYKIPLAAWKLTYNLLQVNQGFSLLGAALVDNCTDENWDDAFVSVVTGNPISFSSPDLAKINEPQRQTVRIVEVASLGHVEVEDGRALAFASRSLAKSGKAIAATGYSSPQSAHMSVSNRASFGMAESGLESFGGVAPMADSPGVEAEMVGDFAVFTSREPVTIKAKQSAVVPMFTIDLPSSGIVLLYKESSHPRRPYRAVKFKNEATHDLGKGKVVVYTDGVFQGESVLETAKPGENRILTYCLENGVKIVKESAKTDSAQTKLFFDKGYGYEEQRFTGTTKYAVTNKKAEPFKVMIEHMSLLNSDEELPLVEGVEVKTIEKITNGHRIYFDLKPNQELQIVVVEKYVYETQNFIGNNYNWIVQKVINPKHPLSKDPAVKTCIDLQKEINKVSNEIANNQKILKSLDEDSQRHRDNIGSVKDQGGASRQVTEWVKELDEATKRIKMIKATTIPSLEEKKQELEQKLSEALEALHASWTA